MATVLVLGSHPLGAVEAVSNLGEPSDGYHTADPGQWVGVSFQTGSTAMNLESVGLRALDLGGAGGFMVSLASDPDSTLGGVPGGVLAVLSGDNPGPLNVYNFVAPADTLLAANSVYWILATPPAEAGSYAWYFTSSTAETGLPGWLIGDTHAISDDQGLQWYVQGVDSPSPPAAQD